MVQTVAQDGCSRVSSGVADQGSGAWSVLFDRSSNDAERQATRDTNEPRCLKHGGGVMELGVHAVRLVSSDDLASAFGYAAPNDAFRGFCRNLGITPVRRNPNFFDIKLVRARLDQAQGLEAAEKAKTNESLVERRRARRGLSA
jgi:hypothetical protein